jgi:bisphosphoglycerate-dependent phosphoglycerate mutase
MFLEHIGEEAIADFDLPTGIPRQYTLDANLRVEQVSYL